MTIGVDAGCLSVADRRLQVGVYQLAFNLLKNLSRQDSANEYILYSFSDISQKVLPCFGQSMKNKTLRPKRFWLSARLSLEFLFKKPDIFLGLGQAIPIFHPFRSIIFVYDLAFEYFPDCYLGFFNKLSRQTKYAVDHSNKIVAISRSTKNDLIKLYGVSEDKIEVIYPGVDLNFKPKSPKEVDRVKEKYGLNSPYFLFVGSLKPIKNIPRIIGGFNKFLREVQNSHQLILVGSDFWLDKRITTQIKKFELEEKVAKLGYLPREDLPGLYSGATAFIAPSLYEGFGIPLLEAMACGVPVITSDRGSMPEVVNDAGLLVNPESIDEIGTALIKITRRDYLRNKLKKKCIKQAGKFSWHKFAGEVLSSVNNLK